MNKHRRKQRDEKAARKIVDGMAELLEPKPKVVLDPFAQAGQLFMKPMIDQVFKPSSIFEALMKPGKIRG